MSSFQAPTTVEATDRATTMPFRARALYLMTVLVTMTLSGCLNKDASPDPFVGPSELGLSLSLSASPDVLPTDGSSQSLVTILARDGAGQAIGNITLRLQLRFGGVLQDVGRISASTLVTGQNGTAAATYTAPIAGDVDGGAVIELLVTPVGDNFANAVPRTLIIRLVPTGVVVPPQNYTTGFRFSPASPAEFQDVLFETNCLVGTVDCVNDPSGQIVSYEWDFGDGTTGSGSSVTHAYSSPATYSVTLTVADAVGRGATAIKSVTVISGGTPTATFTSSPSSPNLGDTVFFNATTSTAPAGRSIVSYAWTFGDGTSGSGVTVSHGYDLAAAYQVTLTVTDDRGAVGSTSTTVTVANSRPSVDFVFSPSTPAVDTAVFFDASVSRPTVPGRTLVSYAWVFGDGATGSGPTTSHTYSSASTYSVTLTVTDNLGEKNTANATVPVGSVVVSASFTWTSTTLVGDRVVNFDASASTGNGLTYTWNFGDGEILTATVPTISYAFVDDSIRNVVLTVTDIAGNSASTTVTVDPAP